MSTTPFTPPGWDRAAELERKQRNHLGIHGAQHTFAAQGGAARQVDGILRFGDDFEDSEPGSDAGFWVILADIEDLMPDVPNRGDRVVIDNVSYTIAGDTRPDGQGGIWMDLRKTTGV